MIFEYKCSHCGEVDEYYIKSSERDNPYVVCTTCESVDLKRHFSSAPAIGKGNNTFGAYNAKSKTDLGEWRKVLDRIDPQNVSKRNLV